MNEIDMAIEYESSRPQGRIRSAIQDINFLRCKREVLKAAVMTDRLGWDVGIFEGGILALLPTHSGLVRARICRWLEESGYEWDEPLLYFRECPCAILFRKKQKRCVD